MDLLGPRHIKGDGKFYSINLIDTTKHSCYVKAVRTKSSDGIIEAIASFWKTHGMPDALQMDNELAFRGSNRDPCSFGKVVRFALNQGVAESDKVIKLVNIALSKGEHWMACNQSLYFIDKSDVHFFKLQNEAKEFSNDNLSDRDAHHVIYFNSILDIFTKLPYTENRVKNMVNNPDINGLHNHEGNDFTDSLIEHIQQQQLSLFKLQLKTNVMNNEKF